MVDLIVGVNDQAMDAMPEEKAVGEQWPWVKEYREEFAGE